MSSRRSLAEGAWCDSSEDISDDEHFDRGILKEVTQFSSAAETLRALEEVVEEWEGVDVDIAPAGDIALSVNASRQRCHSKIITCKQM